MGQFPRKAALALATAVVLLGVAHIAGGRIGSRIGGLNPAILPQAARLRMPHAPAATVAPSLATAPLNGVQQAVTGGGNAKAVEQAGSSGSIGWPPHAAPIPLSGRPTLMDDSSALDPLYAQLWALQQHAVPQVVTVLHYGDSPTTADLITGDVRALLQVRFGDAGHGFNLAAKPWAWYGHRNVEMSDKGWASSQKDATGVGRMKPSVYGLGGAVFAGGAGAQTTYTLKDASNAPQTAVVVDYLASPEAGTLTVSANEHLLATIATTGAGPMVRAVPLPAGTTMVKLAVAGGTVKVFGVDFRRGDNGILYDSLGLNGATTTVVSRTFDRQAWAAELQAVKPSLIVINYGTNESQYGGLVDTLEKELRMAIEKTRRAAPGVPILVMSPMDRGEQGGMGEVHTNPQIPKIVAIQQQVAAEQHCAFFNTYAAMGGEGTMARWSAAKPRLVTADLIHPTPQGAEYVARMFVSGLYGGFDRWKQVHGIGSVAAQDTVQAAAAQNENVR